MIFQLFMKSSVSDYLLGQHLDLLQGTTGIYANFILQCLQKYCLYSQVGKCTFDLAKTELLGYFIFT